MNFDFVLFISFFSLLNIVYCSKNVIPFRRVISSSPRHNKWMEQSTAPVNKSEPMLDYSNTLYIASLTIGTPEQIFNVVMDTASSILWVPGSNCYGCRTEAEYNSTLSSTYENDDTNFNLQYPTSLSVSGQLAKDVVCIAGICVNNTFGMATEISDEIDSMYGYCGLAFASLTELHVMSPVQTMILGNMLVNPWFTIWLTSVYNAEGQVGGQMTLGDYDTEHCSSKCDWVPLTNSGFYQVELYQVQLGSYASDLGGQIISDTSAMFILGPADTIKKIAQFLGGKLNPTDDSEYLINCGLRETLPPVEFILSNQQRYSVSAYSYIVETNFDNVCQLGFGVMEPSSRITWVFGQVFIREYCQVYDMKNNRLGICANKYPGHKVERTTVKTSHTLPHFTTPATTAISPPTIVLTKSVLILISFTQIAKYFYDC